MRQGENSRTEPNEAAPVTPSSLRVVFMGTPDFAVPSLLALIRASYRVVGVVTQPDRPQGRHMTMTPPPVKTAALAHSIPVLQPEKIRDPAFFEQLRDLAPDLIVTAAYGKILPEPILSLPRFGAVNVHASLLPLYRGAAPVHWCIINGDRQTGVTIMKMDKGMDTGDILYQKTVDIPLEANTEDLMNRLAEVGAMILSATILDYCAGRIQPIPQDHARATSVKPITKEDGRIDWSCPAQTVCNLIRGCNPWPVAYTFYEGKRLKIYKARLPDAVSDFLQREFKTKIPGEIVLSEDRSEMFIQCADEALQIMELQLEGSKRMPAKDCAHNFKPIRL